MLLLSNARLLDGTGGPRRAGAWMVVDGERIAEVGWEGRSPPSAPDARRIDLAGQTLLPGLINLHVHFQLDASGDTWGRLQAENDQLLSLRSVKIAERVLRAGVTSVRDLGAKGPGIIALRQVIDEGLLPGPRIQAAGQPICMTGGHFRVGGSIEANGPAAVMAVAREQLTRGADVLKFMASAGMTAPPGVPLGAAELTREELQAGVEVAHQRGRPAAAHALSAAAIKNAILAGMDTIEHGSFLDDECLELFVKHGPTFVPTLTAYHQMELHAGQGALPPRVAQMAAEVHQGHLRVVKQAFDAGVKIGVGSDAGSHFNPHEDVVTELELLAETGIPHAEILRMAGQVSADALGWGDRLGTLEAGKLADVIAVRGDPLTDLATLREVALVIKGGQVVVGDGDGAGSR
jgi:imidazolonepropionase-like amidohydrolase